MLVIVLNDFRVFLQGLESKSFGLKVKNDAAFDSILIAAILLTFFSVNSSHLP